MKRRVLLVAVMLWSLAVPAALRADDDVLSLIPADAFGFVTFNHLQTFSDKVQKLATQMQVPAPPLLPLMKGPLGIRNGTDDDGTFALVVMPGGEDDAPPAPFLMVPVTDYKKFIVQLHPDDANAKIATVVVMGQTSLVAKKSGYAVFAMVTNEDELETFLSAKGSIASKVTSIKDWVGSNDISAVLTHTGMTKLISVLQQTIEKFKQFGGDNEQISKAVAMQQLYLDGFKALEEQIVNLGAGLRIDEEGNVHLSSRGPFKPGGSWAKQAEAIKPLANGALFGLPDGEFVAAFGGPVPEGLGDLMSQLTTISMQMNPSMAKLPEESVKNLQEVTAALVRDARGMASLLGVGKPGESIYSHTASIIRVDDAKAYLASYRKSIELIKPAYDEMGIKADIQPLSLSGLEGVEMTMDMSGMLEKLGQGGGGNGGAGPGVDFARMFGLSKLLGDSGKLTTYIAIVGSKAVVSATNKLDLRRVVDNVRARKPGLADNSDVADTTKLLPSGSQWLGYVSPQGAVKWVLAIVDTVRASQKEAGANGIPEFNAPEFPATIPIGFAGKASAEGFEGDLVVPNKVLTSAADYARTIQQERMKARQAVPAGGGEVEPEAEEAIGE